MFYQDEGNPVSPKGNQVSDHPWPVVVTPLSECIEADDLDSTSVDWALWAVDWLPIDITEASLLWAMTVLTWTNAQ